MHVTEVTILVRDMVVALADFGSQWIGESPIHWLYNSPYALTTSASTETTADANITAAIDRLLPT